MMKIFPPPDERRGAWEELMLGVNSMNSFREIVEDFWPIIMQILEEVRTIDIKGPQERAWFHLRRVNHLPNPEPPAREHARGRIEILRVKKDVLPRKIQGKLRNLPERDPQKYGDIVCAGWWPISLADRDNSFFSFLQKLSVIRYSGMVYDEFLARPQDIQKAYQVMMDPSKPWYEPLAPWFDIIKSSTMENEYAHWFGLILSEWPNL